jgi:hypothetical protein
MWNTKFFFQHSYGYLYPEDGGNMIFLNNSTPYQNTRCQNTEYQNMTREQFFFS